MSTPRPLAENPPRPAGARGVVVALVWLVVAVAVAFLVGRYPVTPADLLQVLGARLGWSDAPAPLIDTIVMQVRGPRVLAALMVGAALALSGAAFQGLFRNPLVSPDILGVSAGAALGALVGILFSFGGPGVQVAAFLGGLLAVALVYGLAARAGGDDPPLTLLLTGLVIGALLGAGAALVKTLADPQQQLPAMTFWLLGSLAGVRAADLLGLAVALVLGGVALIALRWTLNPLSLPDDEARSLGLPTRRLRWVVVAAATLLTAASVAAAGVVGWIGLIVPHAARMLVGPSFPRLLPASTLLGAGTLLLVDTLARSAGPTEIPLGVLTAMIGAPAFLVLLRRSTRGAP